VLEEERMRGRRKRKESTGNGKVDYQGEWLNNQPHGLGVLYDRNGNQFEGVFEHGRRLQGTTTFVNGDCHIGSYKDNMRHGLGHIYVFWNGDRYEGEMQQGKIQGKGRFRWACGEYYSGDLLDGEPHGVGTKVLKNGDRYCGQWKYGEAHGWGTKTFANGDKHNGQYKHNKRDGFGVYTWYNGDTYEGYYKAGRACGIGYKKVGGVTTLGEFRKDRLSGMAMQSCEESGVKVAGFFKKDERHGNIRVLWDNTHQLSGMFYRNELLRGTMQTGDQVFDGEFQRGRAHGVGIQLFPNGDIYRGYFSLNKRSSSGEYRWSQQSTYEGEWENGLEHGQGVLSSASTVVHRGHFRYGKRHGSVIETLDGSNHSLQIWNQGTLEHQQPLADVNADATAQSEEQSVAEGDNAASSTDLKATVGDNCWSVLSVTLRDSLLWNQGVGDTCREYNH